MPAATGPVTPGTRVVAIRPSTLVWIDSREAIIVRWAGGRSEVRHLRSMVPVRRRATGHVRHDPCIRHGGGGPQSDEPHRLEHLDRFMAAVEGGLPADDDLYLLGPGAIHEQLAARLREHDRGSGIPRRIRCETAARLTDPQLVARLREAVGSTPRRRCPTTGALRPTPSGHLDHPPASRGTEG